MATTRYTAGMRTAAPEMDQAVRDAYFSYFSSASSRHSIWSKISATPSAMPAGVSIASTRTVDMSAGDAAKGVLTLLWVYLTEMILFLSYYIVLPLLGVWILNGVVDWEGWVNEVIGKAPKVLSWTISVVRSTVQLAWFYTLAASRIAGLRNAIDAVQSDWSYRQISLGQKYNNLRYNEFTDTAQLRYQLFVIWMGKRKYQISAILLAMWLAYNLNRHLQAPEGERFVSWSEFPRYFDQPIPEVLLRPRKLDGSNSHYVPDVLEHLRFDERVVEVVGESTVPSWTATIVGSGNAYCRKCRQSHCCGVY